MGRQCSLPRTEVIFNALIAGLFGEGRMPPGSVLDAGALGGEWSCMYAGLDRSRTVHGLDPLHSNIQRAIGAYASDAPNLRLHVGGLGDRPSMADAGPRKVGGMISLKDGRFERAAEGKAASNTSFPIHTIDALFSPGGLFGTERLGFAHIDVEGFELPVMRGARAILERDRPVVTVEAHVHLNLSYTRELLAELEARQYDMYLVEEPCGVRFDCRNFIGFPHSRRAEFAGSPALQQALASLALQPANPDNVGQLAFPCCARGGECCQAVRGARCCTEYTALSWLKAQVDPPPFSRQGWVAPKLAF